MAHYRTYSIEFKRAVVQQFLAGEISLLGLAKQHRVGRNLIRLWLVKYEAGEFNEEAAMAASLEEYEARIAMLERKVGQLTMENDVLKKRYRALGRGAAGSPRNVTLSRVMLTNSRHVPRTLVISGLRKSPCAKVVAIFCPRLQSTVKVLDCADALGSAQIAANTAAVAMAILRISPSRSSWRAGRTTNGASYAPWFHDNNAWRANNSGFGQ